MVRLAKTVLSLGLLLVFIQITTSQWLIPVGSRVLAAQQVDFKRDIEPIFRESCLSCHGSSKALGQLRLDLKSRAMSGGISGAAIVPGRSGESRLVKRLRGEGSEVQMPLGGALSAEQVAQISRWIDQGAQWPDDKNDASESAGAAHWSYVKPLSTALPAVKLGAWVRNPIDSFILARLEKEGLQPSPEAERGKLLRRLFLDLIGLPPSAAELDAFISDTRPDSYERAVDALLASKHFGERWARPWLDLARYADSNGYEKDNLRVMWKYRDWVINAFNCDLPYDQFTIEQIAGDILPNATNEQRIATGFHRNTMLNQEGGIDPEEARFETIVDRVNTTATVWLGSTLGCAQCHNHKYDPFSQKDYYRFYAFFEGSEYKIEGEGSERYVKEPELLLANPEQEKKRLEIRAEKKKISEELKTQTKALDAAQSDWEKAQLDLEGKWRAALVASLRSDHGTILTQLSDSSIIASGPNPEIESYSVTLHLNPGRVSAFRVEALVDARLPKTGPGRDIYGNFLLTGVETELASALRPTETTAVALADAAVDDSAVRFEAKRVIEAGQRNNAVDSPAGWYINATRDQSRFDRQAVFVFAKPLVVTAPSLLTVRLRFEGGSLGQAIGRFRISLTESATPTEIVKLPAKLRPVLHQTIETRSEKGKDDLSEQFRAVTPLLKRKRDRLRALNAQLDALGIIPALVMQERPNSGRSKTFVRERGSFLAKGEEVDADVPGFLPRIPDGQSVNRLALARWLVSAENPLTARVAVNRIWEQIFGRGIVETSEDFGFQSSGPTHPELLDWLAVEFRKQGWRTKALLKTIVMSSTYRQDSKVSETLYQRDPDNRLLARGPRFRIEAEMVRDIALTASGLLSKTVGGPSVYPSQPEGIWRNPYSRARWVTSPGDDKYRRSIYTFIRRTSPYPSLTTFDATSREACTVRRVRTNTPLQALTTLNDEAFFDLARGLASRMMAEGGAGLRQKLDHGFRLCTSRHATAGEIDRLATLYFEQQTSLKAKPELAMKIQHSTKRSSNAVDLASMTMVANVLLNLDETINKE
jgi:mono/diheme cytochrome c family protein